MKKYKGSDFILQEIDDLKSSILFKTHSEIPNFPPDLNKYPLLKNAKCFVVELDSNDALFIPSCWWHWVISSNDSFAISTVSDIDYIDKNDKNCNLYKARKNLTNVNKLENHLKSQLLSDRQSENIQYSIEILYKNSFELLENHNFNTEELFETTEEYLNENNDILSEHINNLRPLKIKMNNLEIDDTKLSKNLSRKNLSVIVSTNSSITSVDKPNFRDTKIMPGVRVTNCNYNDFLKISNDKLLYSYIGMSGFYPKEINYKDPIFIKENFKNKPISTYIWASKKNIDTGLHFDISDNILHVIRGRKKIFLFPPSESKYLYRKDMYKHTGLLEFKSI